MRSEIIREHLERNLNLLSGEIETSRGQAFFSVIMAEKMSESARRTGASSKDGGGGSSKTGSGGASKTGGGGGGRSSGRTVLDRLLRFVYKQLGVALNPWFKERMLVFNDDAEHQLEWYDAFTEFKELIESRLEGFVRDEEGYESIGDVFDDIRASMESDESQKQVKRLEKLLGAAAEYEPFCEMMKKKAARYRKKAQDAKEDESEGAVVFFEQE